MNAKAQPPSEPSRPWAVVVSWNVEAPLCDCLASLAAAEPRPRVVVVDNASTDGTCACVRERFPDVLLLANADNRGFAAATNQGVRAALDQGADRLLLLNPDATLAPGALATLAGALDREPGVGIAAPAIITADGAPQAFAFGGDPSLGYLLRRGVRRLLRRGPLHDWGSRTELEPDWVTGACLLARAEVFRGGVWFDEGFFLYFEDNDWCLRARRAGWRIRRVPDATACHLGGASLRRNAAAQDAYARSLRRFYAKHYPRWHGWCLKALSSLYARALPC